MSPITAPFIRSLAFSFARDSLLTLCVNVLSFFHIRALLILFVPGLNTLVSARGGMCDGRLTRHMLTPSSFI